MRNRKNHIPTDNRFFAELDANRKALTVPGPPEVKQQESSQIRAWIRFRGSEAQKDQTRAKSTYDNLYRNHFGVSPLGDPQPSASSFSPAAIGAFALFVISSFAGYWSLVQMFTLPQPALNIGLAVLITTGAYAFSRTLLGLKFDALSPKPLATLETATVFTTCTGCAWLGFTITTAVAAMFYPNAAWNKAPGFVLLVTFVWCLGCITSASLATVRQLQSWANESAALWNSATCRAAAVRQLDEELQEYARNTPKSPVAGKAA
jgi:hypothetical protein